MTPGLTTIVVGAYKTACGGLDTVPSFDLSFSATAEAARLAQEHADLKWNGQGATVIAEGVLASTVWSSWSLFDRNMEANGHQFAWCYLDTPLEACFERIRARQAAAGKAGKVIKADLVTDKHRAILATRTKALADGRLVYDLPWQTAEAALRKIIHGEDEGQYHGRA
jgi:hypothetical protein